MSNSFLASKQIALVAVFAALQAILGTLPYSITVGVSGNITLGMIGGPLIGILLGPFLGGLAVLLGSLIGVFANPTGAFFGILSVLPPTLGAAGAGFMMRKRGFVPGAIILVSMLAFYGHPFGRESLFFPWLHIIAVVLAFVFSTRIAVWASNSLEIQKLSLVVPIAAFVGTLTDHMFGSGLAIWYFNPSLTPQIWNLAMFIYPVERIVGVILISIIGIPLLYSLQKAGVLQIVSER